MRYAIGRFLPILFLPVACVASAQTGKGETSLDRPAIVSSLENAPFKQQKVADCAEAKTPLQWNSVKLSYSSDGLLLEGSDRNGGRWSALVPAGDVLTCEVWSSKLYKGSDGDLIIMNGSQYEGGYGSELTVLSFDSQGRPFPWRSTGAFTVSRDGITRIVKLGSEDNASIIVSKREGDKHDGYAYIHSLVTVGQNGMSKISGSRYNNSWPLITGNTRALSGTESSESLSEARDLSLPQSSTVTLKGVNMPSSQPPVLGGITVSDGTSTMFPSMLVVDSNKSARTIYFAGDVPEALAKMKGMNYEVRLIGQTCKEEECRPLLMIAMER